jgi:hypothetical protein
MSDERQYVIWSHEHGMWWGPNHCGYTPDLSLAGLYTAEEAGEIMLDAYPPGCEVGMPQSVAERRGPSVCFGYAPGKDRTVVR